MGLTSGSLIALLTIMAVCATAGTVWLWPRMTGPRIRTVLSRVSMLGGAQLTLTLALLAALNAQFVFFSNRDELLGTGTVKATTSTHSRRSTATVVGSIDQGEAAKNGLIQFVQIQGSSTGLSDRAYVMLPAQYFQPKYARTRFPVVLVLAGYPGNPTSIIHVMGFPGLVSSGEASGQVQPMIYVLMRPSPLSPRDTECTDIPGGPQVSDFFGDDVPQAISSTYRTSTSRSGWAAMGDSTGGYCAAKIVMEHSDRYSAAVSLSGYFHSLMDVTTGDLYGNSSAIRNENDLFWRIQHLPAPPVSILITSCKVGEKSYPQAMQFLAMANKPPLSTDSLILPSGGHNFETFARMVPGALEWLSVHLQTN